MLLKDFVKLVFSYVYMIRKEGDDDFIRCTYVSEIPHELMKCAVVNASVHNSELHIEVKEERK